jgi:hypothetical protein
VIGGMTAEKEEEEEKARIKKENEIKGEQHELQFDDDNSENKDEL